MLLANVRLKAAQASAPAAPEAQPTAAGQLARAAAGAVIRAELRPRRTIAFSRPGAINADCRELGCFLRLTWMLPETSM